MNQELNLQDLIPKIQADRERITQSLQDIEVVDETTSKHAGEAMTALKARLKKIEELRQKFLRPVLDQQRTYNELFKNESAPLEALYSSLASKVKGYMMAEQEKALEAERKRQEEIARQKQQASEQIKSFAPPSDQTPMPPIEVLVAPVEAPVSSVQTSSGTISKRSVWKWELADKEALLKSRPDLFILDEKRINAEVKAGAREIDGLKIYEDFIIATKTK